MCFRLSFYENKLAPYQIYLKININLIKMGTCIRRETGIELEDEGGDILNHKDIRENIVI